MTNSEAIVDLQFLARRFEDLDQLTYTINRESLDLAILALEENTKLKAENERLNTALDTLVSKIKDHGNTEKVSTAKLIKGKHNYYRAISVTKVIKLINELKTKTE